MKPNLRSESRKSVFITSPLNVGHNVSLMHLVLTQQLLPLSLISNVIKAVGLNELLQ